MKKLVQPTREKVGGSYWRILLAQDLNEVEMLQITHVFFDQSIWLQVHFPELYVWLSFHSNDWSIKTSKDFVDRELRHPRDQVWLMIWNSNVDELFWKTWGCDEIS